MSNLLGSKPVDGLRLSQATWSKSENLLRSLLIPSLMICKAANTWLDSGKELYVDELSRIKPQEASKLEESLLGLGGEAKGTFATSPTSFSGVYNVKDYQIFNSTLGRLVPTCDKATSNLLGSKPVDGLRLSQATWSKSENLLRNS
jgi:hypothetical protein